MCNVSIIMPLYNAVKYVGEAIESILNQSYKDFELIIIDDCSKDGSYSVAGEYAKKDNRIRLLKNEINRGIAYTRNRGIEVSRGQYIGFMDHDDISPENRLKITVDYLEKYSYVGAVGGNYTIFGPQIDEFVVQKMKFYSGNEVKTELLFHNIIPNCSVLLRKSIIINHNLIFEEKYGIEDYCFWSQFVQVAELNLIPQILLKHRVFEEQYSNVCTKSGTLYVNRERVMDEIHLNLLSGMGFILDDKETNIFLTVTREKINSPFSLASWIQLVKVYLNLCSQVKKVKIDETTLKAEMRKIIIERFKEDVIKKNGNKKEIING